MDNEEPHRIGLTWPLILVCGIALPIISGMLMMGETATTRAERIYNLATFIVVAISIAIVEVAAAAPIRQWRRKDMTGEHTITNNHDGTRVIKEIHYGLPPGRMPALEQPQADPYAYPAMVRASIATGMQTQRASQGVPAYVPTSEEEAWDMPPEALDGKNDVPRPTGWTGDIVQ